MNIAHTISFSLIVSTDETFDLDTIGEYVKKIEQSGFSAFLVKENKHIISPSSEPLTLLSALSTRTERIGLVATASTNDNEPYHLARRLASLDHISGGRAGWNIVTAIVDDKTLNDKDSTERAEEFVQVAKGLWDSYADGAVIADKQSGVYFIPDERRALNHNGKYFRVAGPLNISRSPQGYPVLFHSVTSEADIEFAAIHADVILASIQSIDDAKNFRKMLNASLVNTGRKKESVQLWIEIGPVFISSEKDFDVQYDAVYLNNWMGTAEQIANQIIEWHQAGEVDGFALKLSMNAVHTDKFIHEVLPILNERGLFHKPKGNTLRELIGLARPKRNYL